MDNDARKKILIVVEGEKKEVELTKNMFAVFGINIGYQIVSYCTRIYDLYDKMFRDTDPEDMDLLQVLKERERDEEKKKIFDERYTDILLIFDLEVQDPSFSYEHLLEMQRYFSESSDMGKLYINYPMVEAFYHMRSFPDPDYMDRVAALEELRNKSYKLRVRRESKGGVYRKYATSKSDWIMVILHNLQKAYQIIGEEYALVTPDSEKVLVCQHKEIKEKQVVYVLCTFIFFVIDYNPSLLSE